MKSLYDTDGSDKAPEPSDEKKARPQPSPVEQTTVPAGRTNERAPGGMAMADVDPQARSRKKTGAGVLGVINLILLAIIIGFQVKIVLWQTNITTSLKRLEDEVNQEKLQRVELGNDLLKKIEEATTPTAPPVMSAVYQTDQPAAVYAKPNAKSKQLAKLKQGQKVAVEGEEGPWRKVSCDGKSGWINIKYLSKINK